MSLDLVIGRQRQKQQKKQKPVLLSFPAILEEKRPSVFVLSVRGLLAGRVEKVKILNRQAESDGK